MTGFKKNHFKKLLLVHVLRQTIDDFDSSILMANRYDYEKNNSYSR